MSQTTDELAVRKSIEVDCPPATAFRVFTERMADWWPLERYSIFEEAGAALLVEGRVGGRVLERSSAGDEGLWGTITEWDPPHAFAMTWHPGRDEGSGQDLRITFAPAGERTRLELVHTGWERSGPDADERRASYEQGWGPVLALYAEEARKPS